MGTRYTRGRSAEYYVRNKLEKLGAALVIRSAGSHSPADLISIFPDRGEIWLVQVKQSKRGVSIFKTNLEYAEYKTLEGAYKLRFGIFYRTKKGWGDTFAKDEVP